MATYDAGSLTNKTKKSVKIYKDLNLDFDFDTFLITCFEFNLSVSKFVDELVIPLVGLQEDIIIITRKYFKNLIILINSCTSKTVNSSHSLGQLIYLNPLCLLMTCNY